MGSIGRRVAAAALVALALAGCSGGQSPPTGSATSGSSLHGQVTVFAAASLQEAFTTLAKQFEQAHAGVHVLLSFGASSSLAQQIIAGAPADVFASASPANMEQVVKAGQASGPVTFARNELEIAVPPGNPARITAIADLARPGVKVALCQPQVPCGVTAAKALAKAGVSVTPVSQEADVKAVLAKVQLGEVDAGIVYVTDVRAARSRVTGVPIPEAQNASTSYPVATLKAAPNQPAAQAFTAFVRSAAGRAVLAADGFAAP